MLSLTNSLLIVSNLLSVVMSISMLFPTAVKGIFWCLNMQIAKGNTNFQETLSRICFEAKKVMHMASVQANMEDGDGLLSYCQH